MSSIITSVLNDLIETSHRSKSRRCQPPCRTDASDVVPWHVTSLTKVKCCIDPWRPPREPHVPHATEVGAVSV